MYCERFFRDGSRAWRDAQQRKYPGFDSWEGVESFKTLLADRFSIASAQDVFLANRSAQLVRIAARLMFRTCRNVLTCDLNWPRWQSIVVNEAARSGQRITVTPLCDAIFNDHLSADDVSERLKSEFVDKACDGVFLPAVNNLGIQLPLPRLLDELKATRKLRFVLVDAAQSFCHVPAPSPTSLADVTIAGCHKWVRGSLPLGIAVCGRPLVAEQIRTILKSPLSSSDLDDPLLRFSQQICNHSVDHFSETVNVTPLFSANAAIQSPGTTTSALRQKHAQQLANRASIERCASHTSWSVMKTDASLQSGIVLMRSSNLRNTDPDALRMRFHQHGVALSAYSNGRIRISAPTEVTSEESLNTLATAFASVA